MPRQQTAWFHCRAATADLRGQHGGWQHSALVAAEKYVCTRVACLRPKMDGPDVRRRRSWPRSRWRMQASSLPAADWRTATRWLSAGYGAGIVPLLAPPLLGRDRHSIPTSHNSSCSTTHRPSQTETSRPLASSPTHYHGCMHRYLQP